MIQVYELLKVNLLKQMNYIFDQTQYKEGSILFSIRNIF